MKTLITLFAAALCFAGNAQTWNGSTTSTLTSSKVGIGVANLNQSYMLNVENTSLSNTGRFYLSTDLNTTQANLAIATSALGNGKKYGLTNLLAAASTNSCYGIFNTVLGSTAGARMGIVTMITPGDGKVECGIYSAVNSSITADAVVPASDRAAYFRGVVETVAPSATESAFIVRGTSSDVFRIYGDGKVYATEINVVLASQFPDYVFKPEYNLMPLTNLSNYIESNGHLPNMPTAKEIEDEGMNVGELSKTLVEKVEELTLYILEQQKQLDKQKAQIEELTIQLGNSQR